MPPLVRIPAWIFHLKLLKKLRLWLIAGFCLKRYPIYLKMRLSIRHKVGVFIWSFGKQGMAVLKFLLRIMALAFLLKTVNV